nr:RecName: Full=Mu-conotoxin SmIIIA; Flags: Precursor [Conus stercusmuscarum]
PLFDKRQRCCNGRRGCSSRWCRDHSRCCGRR